jgi:hypothetical protein
MFVRRRLALQLTPLLDLLLIVMFSQYIENRDNTRAAEQQLRTQRTEMESELNQRRADLEQEFANDRKTVEDLRKVYDERFRSLIDQHHQIGSLLAESLNLPGVAVAEILKLRTSGSPEDAERLTEATERLQSVMKSRGEEVFRFLIKVDEMQKHVSVWEVHVLDNGQARISDGDQSAVVDFESEAEFSARLFEASKSFADSRTLVILLLTWGDAQGGARQRASNGMPLLSEKLRRDADGTRWYDFSIVGFRQEGPIFSKSPPK